MNFKKLVNDIKETCRVHHVDVYLGKSRFVTYNNGLIKCNGYYDVEKKKLAIATKAKSWELNLVHEFCHFQQQLENCKEWRAYERSQKTGDLTDLAFIGVDVDKKKLRQQLRAAMMMERDCERRVVNLLEIYGYPTRKLSEYIQRANAYTLFYLHIDKSGWYKIGCEPYNKPSVWKHFPATFDIDVDSVYNDLKDLYSKCF